MDLKFRTLRADEIDCRVAQCKKSDYRQGVQLLLYKDARVDMDILDETVGKHRWQRKHYEAKGNMYCSVGIAFQNDNGFDWVWKDDCGAESFTEKEKGEASDSFKRACVNWGIGRELYTSPQIFAEWEIEEDKGKLKPKYNPTFYVSAIDYDDKRNISLLVIRAKSGKSDKEVFNWKKGDTGDKKATITLDNNKPKNKPTTTQNNASKRQIILNMINGTNLTIETVESWVVKRFKKFDINACTEEEFNTLKIGVNSVIGG